MPSTSHVLLELLTTERAYTQDLQTLLNTYLFHLPRFPSLDLSPLEIRLVGRNTAQLARFHASFLRRLERVVLSDEEEGEEELNVRDLDALGGLFVDSARSGEWSVYEEFCEGHATAMRILRRATGSGSRDYERFCANLLKDTRVEQGRLTLEDYLIKPVQQICRYPLLLQNLGLEDAVDAMKGVARGVDRRQGEARMRVFLSRLDPITVEGEGLVMCGTVEATFSSVSVGDRHVGFGGWEYMAMFVPYPSSPSPSPSPSAPKILLSRVVKHSEPDTWTYDIQHTISLHPRTYKVSENNHVPHALTFTPTPPARKRIKPKAGQVKKLMDEDADVPSSRSSLSDADVVAPSVVELLKDYVKEVEIADADEDVEEDQEERDHADTDERDHAGLPKHRRSLSASDATSTPSTTHKKFTTNPASSPAPSTSSKPKITIRAGVAGERDVWVSKLRELGVEVYGGGGGVKAPQRSKTDPGSGAIGGKNNNKEVRVRIVDPPQKPPKRNKSTGSDSSHGHTRISRTLGGGGLPSPSLYGLVGMVQTDKERALVDEGVSDIISDVLVRKRTRGVMDDEVVFPALASYPGVGVGGFEKRERRVSVIGSLRGSWGRSNSALSLHSGSSSSNSSTPTPTPTSPSTSLTPLNSLRPRSSPPTSYGYNLGSGSGSVKLNRNSSSSTASTRSSLSISIMSRSLAILNGNGSSSSVNLTRNASTSTSGTGTGGTSTAPTSVPASPNKECFGSEVEGEWEENEEDGDLDDLDTEEPTAHGECATELPPPPPPKDDLPPLPPSPQVQVQIHPPAKTKSSLSLPLPKARFKVKVIAPDRKPVEYIRPQSSSSSLKKQERRVSGGLAMALGNGSGSAFMKALKLRESASLNLDTKEFGMGVERDWNSQDSRSPTDSSFSQHSGTGSNNIRNTTSMTGSKSMRFFRYINPLAAVES